MEMIRQPQCAPVVEMAPPVMVLQPPQAEAMMWPPMTATQLLQAVELIARLQAPSSFGLCSLLNVPLPLDTLDLLIKRYLIRLTFCFVPAAS